MQFCTALILRSLYCYVTFCFFCVANIFDLIWFSLSTGCADGTMSGQQDHQYFTIGSRNTSSVVTQTLFRRKSHKITNFTLQKISCGKNTGTIYWLYYEPARQEIGDLVKGCCYTRFLAVNYWKDSTEESVHWSRVITYDVCSARLQLDVLAICSPLSAIFAELLVDGQNPVKRRQTDFNHNLLLVSKYFSEMKS